MTFKEFCKELLEEYGYIIFQYDSVISFTQTFPDAICLDHDLGEEESGYDIAKYIVNRCIDEGKKLPLFASQSANPVGRENILSLFKNYEKFHSTRCL